MKRKQEKKRLTDWEKKVFFCVSCIQTKRTQHDFRFCLCCTAPSELAAHEMHRWARIMTIIPASSNFKLNVWQLVLLEMSGKLLTLTKNNHVKRTCAHTQIQLCMYLCTNHQLPTKSFVHSKKREMLWKEILCNIYALKTEQFQWFSFFCGICLFEVVRIFVDHCFI